MRRVELWIFAACALLIFLGVAGMAGLVWIDKLPLAKATPPVEMGNLEDFRDWKSEGIYPRRYHYRDPKTGERYQVFLTAPGRVLASGPAAYLFDMDGRFLDWTPDLGDFATKRHGHDLSLEHLERIR